MTNKMYEIIVAVITGSLARPLFENIKEYTVSVEAASPEEAEKKAMDTIAADSAKFDPMQNRIRIAEIKAIDGSTVVYKDDDQTYRRLARALRAYRMWPYLERCKEFAQDYCVYSGVSVEEAAKMVAADPDVASSPAREARGNQLTIAQQMLAEIKRQNAIRYERAQQPKTETEKTTPAENQEPLYPEAGPERYHRMDPEISRTMANLSKPEQTVRVDNEQSAEAAVNSLVGSFDHEDFYNFKEENPYDKLAEQTAPKTELLTFDVDLEYQNRICRVKRQISVLNEEKNFYHGYVYHSNGSYLGHWYWNVKYLRPIFTPKQNIGDGNKDRYEVAIRKALKTIGVYCIYMPESADRKSKAI